MKWFALLLAAMLALPIAGVTAQTPPSGTPPTTQTSVPGHPLQVLYGPHPGSAVSHAHPDVSGLAHMDGVAALAREFGNRVPTRLPGYQVTQAGADGGRALFQAQVWFTSDDGSRTIHTNSWTKTGDFVTTVPADSPVTEIRQTNIAGLAALTLLPTPAVSGGIGPRTIYLTDGATVWVLELEGFTRNSDALEAAAAFAAVVTTPAPPAVGDSAAGGDRAGLSVSLAGVALVASGAVLFGFANLWRRRYRA